MAMRTAPEPLMVIRSPAWHLCVCTEHTGKNERFSRALPRGDEPTRAGDDTKLTAEGGACIACQSVDRDADGRKTFGSARESSKVPLDLPRSSGRGETL